MNSLDDAKITELQVMRSTGSAFSSERNSDPIQYRRGELSEMSALICASGDVVQTFCDKTLPV